MRALRVGAVVLVILALLFVAADRIAVNVAENQAADQIKRAQHIPSSGDVSVGINGFPFLTQAAGQELDDVDAELTDMPAKSGKDDITVTRVSAHLKHVRLSSDYASAVARDATGTALISYADITRSMGSDATVAWGGKGGDGRGRVKVTGSLTLPGIGKKLSRSVTSSVSVGTGNSVKLHADKVPGSGFPGIEDLVRKKTDHTSKLSGLPDGLKLKKVQATAKGLRLTMSGSDVKLAG